MIADKNLLKNNFARKKRPALKSGSLLLQDLLQTFDFYVPAKHVGIGIGGFA